MHVEIRMNSLRLNTTPDFTHLASLDGFRATLALWVYLGHVAYAVGLFNPALALHPIAVDLFMVLSGYLMVHTWKGSLGNDKFLSRTTLAFYSGRFFRIAPLYYFLLLLSYFALPTLAEMHDVTAKVFPPPWASDLANYAPQTSWNFDNFRWFFLHTSFLFGLVPGMESSTPLPDWSLSLEMQFYLFLPALLIFIKKIPPVFLAITVALMCVASPKLLGNYLDPGWLVHFGQPSALPYRLNAFVAGMILAIWLKNRDNDQPCGPRDIYAAVSAMICILPLIKPAILLYLLFVLLATGKTLIFSSLFSLKPLRFLSEISYSIYLCHILIVTPVVFWLTRQVEFINLSPLLRFLIAVGISAPLVIAMSYGLFHLVETPFIKLGRKLAKGIGAVPRAQT